MNFIIWLIVGGAIGWLGSMILKIDAEQGTVVGVVGALLGGWLISPLAGAGTLNQDDFSLGGLFVSLIGAIILLGAVTLLRRGRVR
jgi:uncharacterized membrane protein YeaQ/YmgE (transglycosylase-associated protein family)